MSEHQFFGYQQRRIIYRASSKSLDNTPPVVSPAASDAVAHYPQTAKVYIEPFEANGLLAAITTSRGDHHELMCLDPVDARRRVDFFCQANNLTILTFVMPPECRTVNCGVHHAGGARAA